MNKDYEKSHKDDQGHVKKCGRLGGRLANGFGNERSAIFSLRDERLGNRDLPRSCKYVFTS
jgi:hypothetical protein